MTNDVASTLPTVAGVEVHLDVYAEYLRVCAHRDGWRRHADSLTLDVAELRARATELGRERDQLDRQLRALCERHDLLIGAIREALDDAEPTTYGGGVTIGRLAAAGLQALADEESAAAAIVSAGRALGRTTISDGVEVQITGRPDG